MALLCLVQTNHLATTEVLVVVAATTHNNNDVGVLGMRNGAASVSFLSEALWEDSPPWGRKRKINLFDAVERTVVVVVAANHVGFLVVGKDRGVPKTANVEKRPISGPCLACSVENNTRLLS